MLSPFQLFLQCLPLPRHLRDVAHHGGPTRLVQALAQTRQLPAQAAKSIRQVATGRSPLPLGPFRELTAFTSQLAFSLGFNPQSRLVDQTLAHHLIGAPVGLEPITPLAAAEPVLGRRFDDLARMRRVGASQRRHHPNGDPGRKPSLHHRRAAFLGLLRDQPQPTPHPTLTAAGLLRDRFSRHAPFFVEIAQGQAFFECVPATAAHPCQQGQETLSRVSRPDFALHRVTTQLVACRQPTIAVQQHQLAVGASSHRDRYKLASAIEIASKCIDGGTIEDSVMAEGSLALMDFQCAVKGFGGSHASQPKRCGGGWARVLIDTGVLLVNQHPVITLNSCSHVSSLTVAIPLT